MAPPTKTPVTLLGSKTAKVMTTSPLAGKLPAMSRMPLPPECPTRVSWYRPLASGLALLKSISSLPVPPVPASRYLTVMFESMGMVVAPVP